MGAIRAILLGVWRPRSDLRARLPTTLGPGTRDPLLALRCREHWQLHARVRDDAIRWWTRLVKAGCGHTCADPSGSNRCAVRGLGLRIEAVAKEFHRRARGGM